ncbi:hypothetical protein [Pedobacter frigoris]|uniref:Uncharacterized protein n=1 Tax=Pedobacter frigoris TaxID=2571272 RepID=A0A4U1CKF7_9SPHI|nr:hypothetical protein [Pedobacter frigoris]TKC07126.1 hypothetical protein FA047_07655 [Pedobacter frigoris]
MLDDKGGAMGQDYKALYETVILELEFQKWEREKLKDENALLDGVREIQTEHLLKREKMIKEWEGRFRSFTYVLDDKNGAQGVRQWLVPAAALLESGAVAGLILIKKLIINNSFWI